MSQDSTQQPSIAQNPISQQSYNTMPFCSVDLVSVNSFIVITSLNILFDLFYSLLQFRGIHHYILTSFGLRLSLWILYTCFVSLIIFFLTCIFLIVMNSVFQAGLFMNLIWTSDMMLTYNMTCVWTVKI